jgi:hypothetical protein
MRSETLLLTGTFSKADVAEATARGFNAIKANRHLDRATEQMTFY